jgi:hypothetical protein
MTLDWTLPSPPNGVVGTPSTDTNAQAALFYGEDIWFDVTKGAAELRRHGRRRLALGHGNSKRCASR